MFKVGDKVKMNKYICLNHNKGDLGEVVQTRSNVCLIDVNGAKGWYFDWEIEKINNKTTDAHRISTLEKEVELLKNELDSLKKTLKTSEVDNNQIIDLSEFAHVIAEKIRKKKLSTPNEQRKMIIEEAKNFIEETKTDFIGRDYETRQMVSYESIYEFEEENLPTVVTVCRVEFIVNLEKLTVVALLKPIESNRIVSKEIAKCDPDDVFNEHIGKAIALGRALELDVSEFENAVQPNEVVVGHKVSNELNDKIHEITSIVDFKLHTDNTKLYWDNKAFKSGIVKIFNDTNAQY